MLRYPGVRLGSRFGPALAKSCSGFFPDLKNGKPMSLIKICSAHGALCKMVPLILGLRLPACVLFLSMSFAVIVILSLSTIGSLGQRTKAGLLWIVVPTFSIRVAKFFGDNAFGWLLLRSVGLTTWSGETGRWKFGLMFSLVLRR